MNKIVNSIEAKDIANHFHPYTNPQILKESGPHVICKGEGIYVYDNTFVPFPSFQKVLRWQQRLRRRRKKPKYMRIPVGLWAYVFAALLASRKAPLLVSVHSHYISQLLNKCFFAIV